MPHSRRTVNKYFLAIAILLICARVTGMDLAGLGSSWPDFLWLGLIAFAGILTGLITSRAADIILPSDIKPWYTRPGSFLFLIIVLTLTNIFYISLAFDVIAPLFDLFGPDDAPWFFLLLAAELTGIILFDWPEVIVPRKPENRQPRMIKITPPAGCKGRPKHFR